SPRPSSCRDRSGTGCPCGIWCTSCGDRRDRRPCRGPVRSWASSISSNLVMTLERNVLFLSGGRTVLRGRRAAALPAGSGPAALARGPAADELHVLGRHADLAHLLAVLGLPAVLLEAALDHHLPALLQVLGADLSRLPPRDLVDEGDFFDLLAGLLVRVLVVEGQRELADRRPLRRVPQLGVARQVAEQDDLIERRHESPLSSRGDRGLPRDVRHPEARRIRLRSPRPAARSPGGPSSAAAARPSRSRAAAPSGAPRGGRGSGSSSPLPRAGSRP